jgi:hypothetical protein
MSLMANMYCTQLEEDRTEVLSSVSGGAKALLNHMSAWGCTIFWEKGHGTFLFAFCYMEINFGKFFVCHKSIIRRSMICHKIHTLYRWKSVIANGLKQRPVVNKSLVLSKTPSRHFFNVDVQSTAWPIRRTRTPDKTTRVTRFWTKYFRNTAGNVLPSWIIISR